MFRKDVIRCRNRMWNAASTCMCMGKSREPGQQEHADEEVLYDLAELFKIFGDSTRIKILAVLFESRCASATSPSSWA